MSPSGAPAAPLSFRDTPPFPEAARISLADPRLRTNLARATTTIRARRDRVIAELDDLEELRSAAAAIKDDALSRLDELLERFEERCSAAGAHVHYARDAEEARRLVTELVVATGEREVVKVKSMTTAEVELNGALEAAGIDVAETDLAELIVQLGHDLPSHIVVPAIHRNRSEIRATFLAEMAGHGRPAPADLSDDPVELAGAARLHLRERFLRARVAISGANFAVASTGTLVVVESEGNGRMCLTIPDTLITLVGIDKVIPETGDLEVFLRLLARSATGERLSPYTSFWTGPAAGDGPREVHVVLLDDGRTGALGDRVGRQALRCIRCAACLNVCPVYERVGGHAYGSVYPGPIGAVLTPQLDRVASDEVSAALPFASSLCGACAEVCPVRIDLPKLLVHLRGEVVARRRDAGRAAEAPAANHGPLPRQPAVPDGEAMAMRLLGWVFAEAWRLRLAEGLSASSGWLAGRLGISRLRRLPPPLSEWTSTRDAPLPAAEPFRHWWRREHDAGHERARPSELTDLAPGWWSSLPVRLRALLAWSRGAPRPGTAAGSGSSDERRPQHGAKAGDERGPQHGSEQGRAGVLASVRAAHAAAPWAPVSVERTYRRAGASELAGDELRQRFCERAGDYGAGVSIVGEQDVATEIARALAARGSSSVVVAPGLEHAWLDGLAGASISWREDDGLSVAELDATAALVGTAALAIAETGTIVLDGGPGQGRRALSLLPDHHVVVLFEHQIVADVPDAVATARMVAPMTWISGPSATSDIEMRRVEGVHGPRRLDVILVIP